MVIEAILGWRPPPSDRDRAAEEAELKALEAQRARTLQDLR